MQLNLAVLTHTELKTRKLWIKSFFVFYALLIIINLLSSVDFQNSSEDNAGKLGRASAESLIFIILPAAIFYRCAYKKAGTRLLTLYLYLKPIDILIQGTPLHKRIGILLMHLLYVNGQNLKNI